MFVLVYKVSSSLKQWIIEYIFFLQTLTRKFKSSSNNSKLLYKHYQSWLLLLNNKHLIYECHILKCELYIIITSIYNNNWKPMSTKPTEFKWGFLNQTLNWKIQTYLQSYTPSYVKILFLSFSLLDLGFSTSITPLFE